MANRRPLTEGLHATHRPVDTQLERDFVYQNNKTTSAPQPSSTAKSEVINRVPISTRIRADFAGALKKASLERQLNGISPNTLQDMLEQALEPWLKSNGYVD